MDKSFKFFPVIFQCLDSPFHLPAWDEALIQFQAKDYRSAIHSVFCYINQTFAKQSSTGPVTEYKIRHSSSSGVFRVTETHFELEFPLVRIPNPCPPALLRQVTEVNFEAVSLARIKLKGDSLIFHYRDHLALSHPAKIYSLLREVCINADYYDDALVEKFKAQHMIPPNQKRHSDRDLDRAWEAFQAQLIQAEAYTNHFEQKRNGTCIFDPAAIFLHQASYTLNPHGILRAHLGDLYQAIRFDLPIEAKLKEVRRLFDKIKKLDRPKFIDCMYVAELFLADKRTMEVEETKNFLEQYLNGASQDRQKHDFITSTCGLLSGSYFLLDMKVMPPGIWQVLKAGITSASEKSWQEASNILFEHFEKAYATCEALEQAGDAVSMMQNVMNQFVGKVS